MSTTNTRTDLDMELSGSWAKAGKVGGKQSWRHENGTVVAFDCMAWGWRVNDERGVFKTLRAARWHVEREAAKSQIDAVTTGTPAELVDGTVVETVGVVRRKLDA